MLRLKTKERAFFGVAMAFIMAGSAAVALGIIEWLFNFYGDAIFLFPLAKMFAGFIITGLGYIILQLELIRTK